MPILILSESHLKGEEYFYSFITEHYRSDSIGEYWLKAINEAQAKRNIPQRIFRA